VLVVLDVSELRRLEGVRRDFVANASHELKTPLTAIQGYAETLAEEGTPEELRAQFAETIRVNAARLRRIVDDLLDLSRIESGGWKVHPEAVSIERLAREAWAGFADRAAERGIRFEVHTEGDADLVTADPGALRQVFSNLFSNALRYTEEGGEIGVRISERAGDGVRRVSVRDTGSGIPAAHLPRIFERFYRVDPARSRAEGGRGWGSPSSGTWSRRTAARWARRASWGAAPPSLSPCRCDAIVTEVRPRGDPTPSPSSHPRS
jgi:two-component system, OmpR family, phosphate regulon sensor histidine kinase PhoR